MKVLAAMSGGVDSAVAAARAVDAGHEVVGVHLALSRMPGTLRTGSRGCCTVEDARDAHRAAGSLGIPFYVWDFSERFKEDIVDDFIAEYSAGRTPNPCMRCNERIKFAALLDRALALGFDAVATGHYAEVRPGPSGEPELHRGADLAKDQSYVLGVLDARQLRHSYFPIGITSSKAEVRAEAAERGFTVADKPDSYDICFIPDGDTRSWLADKIPLRPGLIKDAEGTELGEHGGAQTFTIGQRKGLQIDQPAPGGRPRYVVDIDTRANTVTVGSREDLAVTRLRGIRTSWCGLPPEDIGQDEATALDCEVQVRAHGASVPARAWLGSFSDVPGDDGVRAPGQRIEVRLAEPFSGVAPGQTMVLYAGTRVLGQATIDRSAREVAA